MLNVSRLPTRSWKSCVIAIPKQEIWLADDVIPPTAINRRVRSFPLITVTGIWVSVILTPIDEIYMAWEVVIDKENNGNGPR